MTLIKPMKANPIELDQLEPYLQSPDWLFQLKLDGVRCVAHVRQCSIFTHSYNLKPFRNEGVLPLLEPLLLCCPSNTILDGELWAPQAAAVTAGTLNSYTGSLTGIIYQVFDVLRWGGEDLIKHPLIERLDHVYSIPTLQNIAPLSISFSKANKRLLLKEVLSDSDAEGVMLKYYHGLYHLGKRLMNNWFKFKKWSTWDVVLMGFEKAKDFTTKKSGEFSPSKYIGLVGSFTYGMYQNNKLIPLGTCSGMSDSQRLSMTKHPERWIGEVVEIGGRQQLPSGAIHHPFFKQVRKDKDPIDCVLDDK